METDDIAKEIKNLDTKKAILQDNILVKILKLNNDIFSEIFNESIEMTNFPNKLKYACITSVYKKYLLYPKYSNVVFMIKSIKTFTMHGLEIKWAIERDIAPNIH